VIGCGLGDDVCELALRGYDVLGFDVSSSAIDWCKRRHPDLVDRFTQADLLNIPGRLKRRFDLVVEVYTVQSLPVGLRDAAVAGAASLLRPHGTMLVTCRGRDENEPADPGAGPPHALSGRELAALMARHGLSPTRSIDDFLDDEQPPKRRLRGAFRRL
jgi:predicted TPR repeat methyltransferase